MQEMTNRDPKAALASVQTWKSFPAWSTHKEIGPMTKEEIYELIRDRVEYGLGHSESSDSIEDNCGDDPEAPTWIRNELRRGNQWAWCDVEVTAVLILPGGRMQGRDTMGCCSYESEQSFKTGDYYADMEDEALRDLVSKIMDRIEFLTAMGLKVSL